MPGTRAVAARRSRLVLSSCALLAASLLVALAAPGPAAAQVLTLPKVKNTVKNPKPKIDSFSGDVITFSNAAITVRDRKNFALIRTFSYSPELMRKLEDRHMEPGDRVTVRYARGSEVAIGLHGKIRKAELPLKAKPSRIR